MNILAIGHESSRTGAPILLLDCLRWLVRGKHASVRCLLANPGPLIDLFEATCLTRVETDQPAYNLTNRIAQKLRCRDWLVEKRLTRWLRSAEKPDLIYVNTVASIRLLRRIRKLVGENVPVLIHIHELDSVLESYKQNDQIETELQEATMLVAASAAVKVCLLRRFQLSNDAIKVIHDWRVADPSKSLDREQARRIVRQKISASSDAKICLGAGLLSWRKAPELIPIIAKHSLERSANLHFVWIGKETSDRSLVQMRLDTERLGISDRVHFLGEVNDPQTYMLGSDFFALTSREDPYPLVMLEAASSRLAIVGFENSGGASEFIREDAGKVVPYLDLVAFADAITDFDLDPDKAANYGENAERRVREYHQSDATVERLFLCMKKCVTTKIDVKERP